MTQHKISSRTLWIVITLLLVLIAFAAWAFSARQDATAHSSKTHNNQTSRSADHAGKTSPPQAPNHSEVTNANNTLPAASTISTPRATTVPVVNLSRTLPGLGNDAENYASTLESSALGQSFRKKCQDKEKAILNALQSGNTAQAATLQKQYESWKQQERSDALSKADQAYSAGDWPAAVKDYQQRIALEDSSDPQIWWHLANALQKRDRSSAKETKYAAYLAYDRNIYSQKPHVTLLLPTLQILRKALAAEDDHLGEIHLLEAMYRAYPGNAQVAVDLKKTVMHYGFKVQKITPDTNQFPTRTCVQFTAPLSEAPDFHASNWVTFSPAQAHVAVVRENGGICVSGLPAGSSTQMHIRAGLPAIAGAVLTSAQTVTLTLPNRSPSIITDTGRFIIPASLPPAVGFSSINISRVKLKINRVPERALLAFVANHPLLNQDESESTLNNQNSLTIWQGSADIPHFSANRLMHSILPLPKILQKPGLYAIEISPGDGTPNPNGGLNSVQLVLRTNLAPTVWQGRNGLYVQIRHYTDASPWSGVSVKLIAQDNDILQTVQTNANGIAFFPKPILQGSGGQSPAALHIYGPDNEFTLFNLENSSLNLSGRGISGRPALQPVSPFLWLDRGIYRPGETVHVAAIYRSAAGQPLNLPLHLIVRRPGGQVFLDTVPKLSDDDAIAVPVKLPLAAQDGNWSVSLATGLKEPALAQESFTVSAFVPPTLAVKLGTAKPIPAGQALRWPVEARYLYGAPGGHLSGTARISLSSGPTPYPQWQNYQFGLHSEIFTAPVQEPTLPDTDAEGQTQVPINLQKLPDSTRFLEAHVAVSINEPSGRPVSSEIVLPVTPDHPLIGIENAFKNDTVAAGKIPEFHIVALAPDGKPSAMPVQIEVVRQSSQWNISMQHGVASWGYSYVDHPVLKKNISLPAGHTYTLQLPVLDYGRYRLRVVEAHGGLAASSAIFYSGWQTSANPGVPQRVSVRSNTAEYAAGSTADIHIDAPFGGPAVLVLANDRILSLKNFNLPKGGITLHIPVKKNWGAGAYALVDVFRPASASEAPERAIGLTWLGLKPGERAIPVHFDVQPVYRPRQIIRIPVKTRPGAYVTLAAVDQGILNLTQFPNPNPLLHFFGKRRLDISVADNYAALLARPTGYEALLQNGAGANFGPAVRPIPQKVVALFAGPVQANSAGVAELPIDVPEFNGALHLMAVTWQGDAVGAGNADIIVRNRLIANLLLPRFLSPGDNAEATLMLQNLKLPAANYQSVVTAIGPIQVGNNGQHKIFLKVQAMHLLPVTLTGTGEGTAHLTLRITGPGGYQLIRHWDMVVHSTQPPVSKNHRLTLAAGSQHLLKPDLQGFIPGSGTTAVILGNTLPFNPKTYVQALYQGWHCHSLLNAASQGLPLTILKPPLITPEQAAKLQDYVNQVLNNQRYDGAFGLWSNNGDAQPWLTAFATEFLLRAQKAGATVPQPTIDQALHWLSNEVEEENHPVFDRIYAVYDLSLAGKAPAGAIRMLARHMDQLTMPLALAQLGSALNTIGERHLAAQALQKAIKSQGPIGGDWWWGRSDWDAAFGSPLRDAWAVPTIIAQTGLMPDAMVKLRQNLPGAGLEPDSLTTQELAWALYADGVLGGNNQPVHVQWGQQIIQQAGPVVLPLRQAINIRNLGSKALTVALSTTGITSSLPPAADQGMTVSRAFYSLSGKPLQPDSLPQNTVFVVVLKGSISDNLPHRALLNMGLPPGWELAGDLSAGKVHGLPWLKNLSTPEATAATDDRYEAAFKMAPEDSQAFDGDGIPDFKTAILLRAVTPGHYLLPGVTLSDMFHPSIFARSAGRKVSVTAAPAS
ncbi:MG2 domain-containing protein [Acidithiobacillus thiooxidans]|uniref:MG2 domain-containing protein n=1 Tax=Acidithiobacillus thiooxidans TaxID=930 RepID=UPI00285C39A4|nr:MG2 domain-containing protein [Acidithiobacillus thiooxidans]MDR7925820.1 MG2 domain-containing protein [Acidithiobacillus thiooxidans]